MSATETAPFGYKKDGTPRLKPGPAWMNDPAKVAAAAAKRSATRAAKNGTPPPAVSDVDVNRLAAIGAAVGETFPATGDDLLARQRREIAARMLELAPLVDEARRLEAADAALSSV